MWMCQFNLYLDEVHLRRCGGRMAHSDLTSSVQNPVLLDKSHQLTTLIVMDAHRHVLHNSVKEALTELRSTYWVIRRRQFIRNILHKCLICRIHLLYLSIASDSRNHSDTLEWTSPVHCMLNSPLFPENRRCGCAFTPVVLRELFTLI